MARTAISVALFFACTAAAAVAQAGADSVRIGDRTFAVERGAFEVPAVHGRADLGPLTLRFLRFPSTSDRPGPPIVYLAGGPGDSGILEIQQFPAEWIEVLRGVADLVALDQRGTGDSEPAAACPPGPALPLERAADPAQHIVAYRSALDVCLAELGRRGVEPAMFTTAQSVADVEALRIAIGADAIALFGGSYGSHLALATARRWPDRIATLVLFSVEGPDHTLKLPSAIDAGLAGLFAHVRATDVELTRALHDPMGVLRALIARLDAAPERVVTGAGDTVVVGSWDLRRMAADAAGRYGAGRRFPAQLAAMAAGDFSALGEWAVTFRRGAGLSLMGIAMDCASGASEPRLARIRGEAGRSLVGAVIDFPLPGLCDARLPKLPDSFRTPLRSPVRALLIAGTLDARTPVANAREVARTLPNATVLVVQDAPHGIPPLPALPPIIASFLRGIDPPPVPLRFPAWRFEPWGGP